MTDEQKAMSATFYQGWEEYQQRLTAALEPLTREQLALRPGPGLRSIGELAVHIVVARVGWFHFAIGEGSEETLPLLHWQSDDAPVLGGAELASGFAASWRLMQSSLARWGQAKLAEPFQVERGGKEYTFTRQWIIWHLLEHDLHHGGELSLSLGAHGLAAPEV